MQPENLITRPHELLESHLGIQFLNLAGPCMADLDSRYTLRTDSESDGDVFLPFACRNSIHHGSVSLINGIHSILHPCDDSERVGQPLCLDLDEWLNHAENSAAVIRVVDRVRPQAALPLSFSTLVLSHVANGQSGMDMEEDIWRCESNAEAHAAHLWVYLNAPLAVDKGGEIGGEAIRRHVVDIHASIISEFATRDLYSWAVPVVRWIGERIAAVESLAPCTVNREKAAA